MSRGFPVTVGALTLHSFSSTCLLPKKSPPRLFLSPPTPRRDGLQPGGMLTRRAPDMFNRRTVQKCKERNNQRTTCLIDDNLRQKGGKSEDAVILTS
ncbi:unnamed protein product, partial [Boreogadus saida]